MDPAWGAPAESKKIRTADDRSEMYNGGSAPRLEPDCLFCLDSLRVKSQNYGDRDAIQSVRYSIQLIVRDLFERPFPRYDA